MIRFEQIEANGSEVIDAQSPLQWPATHLQRDKIGRQGLKQLLQPMAAGKGAVELNHQTGVLNKARIRRRLYSGFI